MSAQPGVGARLTLPLFTYAFTEEFVLLFPVYALLFIDHGLSVAQISSLFVLWSATGLATNVPAGAVADVLPRRYLLSAAPMITGTAFILWLVFPGYACFATGFVLWGLAGSLSSGAFEALVHTELNHLGLAHRYANTMGVTRSFGVTAVGSATVLAVPVMAWGGYAAVGVASVAACVACAFAGLCLPEHRTITEDDAPATYRSVLHAGFTEVRTDRRVRAAIIVLVVVTAFWGVLDEYLPLLVAGHGVATSTVPVALAVVWAGVTIGGLLAGPATRLSPNGFAALLTIAAVAVSGGAYLRGPVGWVVLGIGSGACQAAGVVVDARLQDSITGPSRATVTSLAGFGTDVVTTTAYPLYAAVFTLTSHATAFALFTVPYLLAACALAARKVRSAH